VAGNYALIRQAIAGRRPVRATYRGRVREMCPHVLGTKNGRARALFFQFAGESEGGLPPGGDWRCLAVDDLTEVSVREGPWRTARNYDPTQSCVDEIDIAV
jgi:hypothetical protein